MAKIKPVLAVALLVFSLWLLETMTGLGEVGVKIVLSWFEPPAKPVEQWVPQGSMAYLLPWFEDFVWIGDFAFIDVKTGETLPDPQDFKCRFASNGGAFKEPIVLPQLVNHRMRLRFTPSELRDPGRLTVMCEAAGAYTDFMMFAVGDRESLKRGDF